MKKLRLVLVSMGACDLVGKRGLAELRSLGYARGSRNFLNFALAKFKKFLGLQNNQHIFQFRNHLVNQLLVLRAVFFLVFTG